jgi:hypothetical protein
MALGHCREQIGERLGEGFETIVLIRNDRWADDGVLSSHDLRRNCGVECLAAQTQYPRWRIGMRTPHAPRTVKRLQRIQAIAAQRAGFGDGTAYRADRRPDGVGNRLNEGTKYPSNQYPRFIASVNRAVIAMSLTRFHPTRNQLIR